MMSLSIAHELTRMLYKFKRLGYMDIIGPAGELTYRGNLSMMR